VLKEPPKAVPVYEPRWTVWGGAYGGSNRTTGDLAVVGSHDLSASTAGFAGGLHYRPTPDTVGGLAVPRGGPPLRPGAGGGGGQGAAPMGAGRGGGAAAGAIPSRPASAAPPASVPPISPRRLPSPTTGCRPTAQPSATASLPISTRRATAGGSKAAIVSERLT